RRGTAVQGVLLLPVIDEWLIYWADPRGPRGSPPRRRLAPDELARLLRTAEMHGVLSIVLQNAAVAEGGAASQTLPSESIASNDAAVSLGLTLIELADALMQLLVNVPATIVKGPVFARSLYPDRALRRFTDIDVLVADDAIPALSEPLGGLGFRLVG